MINMNNENYKNSNGFIYSNVIFRYENFIYFPSKSVRITTAFKFLTINNNEFIAFSYSFTNPKDTFEKKIGRDTAYNKLNIMLDDVFSNTTKIDSEFEKYYYNKENCVNSVIIPTKKFIENAKTFADRHPARDNSEYRFESNFTDTKFYIMECFFECVNPKKFLEITNRELQTNITYKLFSTMSDALLLDIIINKSKFSFWGYR